MKGYQFHFHLRNKQSHNTSIICGSDVRRYEGGVTSGGVIGWGRGGGRDRRLSYILLLQRNREM
jgi:hypothetical protein